MKKILISIFIISIFGFISCKDYEAQITVENKVHNVQISGIKYGDFYLSGYLIPGESSTTTIRVEDKNDFPMENVIEFYMEANGNKVFLKTKEKFKIDLEGNITITITDSTEVINPML
ncbi:MAG: hypothetical protein JXR58_06595 [Bacteroidales bacterium]|nr:hypothetical protein [Bacteroidales bacterium]